MGRPFDKSAGREFPVSNFEFRIPRFEFRQAKPNKPKRLKTFPINNIARKKRETNPSELSFGLSVCYRDFGPNFREIWIGGASLSTRNSRTTGIGATPRRAAGPAKGIDPLIHWFIERLKAAIRFFNDSMDQWRNESIPSLHSWWEILGKTEGEEMRQINRKRGRNPLYY
jgi:hypothetical protein